MSEALKIVVVTDARFLGGTGSAVIADVKALASSGHHVELLFVKSQNHFQPDDIENLELTSLTEYQNVSTFCQANPECDVVFFHNPQAFQKLSNSFEVQARRAFLIVHHPPFIGDGALCYDPLLVERTIRSKFRLKDIEWVPVSGLIRSQLINFRPLLRIHPLDWPNTFDVSEFDFVEPKLDKDILTIGRHGRPHLDKWPDSPDDMRKSLPVSQNVRVRVLGADQTFFHSVGLTKTDWEILPFKSVDVADFLRSIDVYCYHHSKRWREAFGRTVVEAMLMGRPCILDPALRPTFGDHALYCEPAGVQALLDTMADDPAPHIARAIRARDWVASEFSSRSVAVRLKAMLDARSFRDVIGHRDLSRVSVLRKFIGYWRRQYFKRDRS